MSKTLKKGVIEKLTPEFLTQEYLVNRRTMYEIATSVGCSCMTIFRYLEKFKIAIRTAGDARIGRKQPNISKAMRGDKHKDWKGGRLGGNGTYVSIYFPDHPRSNKQGYVGEHLLVIESLLGRPLLSSEEGHHVNKIKHDNRPQNLMAFSSKSAHQRWHRNEQSVKLEEIVFDGRSL